MRRGRVIAAGALAVVVACGAPAPEQPAEPQVSAELLQYRSDQALHRLQAKVTNQGSEPTTVDRIELLLPGFETGPAAEPSSRLEPRRRVDLPVAFGPARCEDGVPAPTPGSGPVLRLWLDGSREPVQVDAADPGDLLPRLADDECAQREVTAAVPVGFAGSWTTTGQGADLEVMGVLELGPVDGPATLVRLDGTTLFRIATATPLPLQLGDAAEVPVTLTPQRCDPHAVAESKRGYAFRAAIVLGESEPVLITVEVDAGQRRGLQDALLEQCGL